MKRKHCLHSYKFKPVINVSYKISYKYIKNEKVNFLYEFAQII